MLLCTKCREQKVVPFVGANVGDPPPGYLCCGCEATFQMVDGLLVYTGQARSYIIGPACEIIPVSQKKSGAGVEHVYVPSKHGLVTEAPASESFDDIKAAWLKCTGQLPSDGD